MKTITGFNKDTAKNLIIDAGAVFVNFDIEEDTVETAQTKLIGATSGGSAFNAKPTFRNIKVDGVKSENVKGLKILESWEVSLKTNLLEFNSKTFEYALASTKITDTTLASTKKYKKIEGKNELAEEDFIDNITYMGSISGSDEPIIIQIFNCLNSEGLKLETKDSEDIVAELEFIGHYSVDSLDKPPFAIYYPDRTPVVIP